MMRTGTTKMSARVRLSRSTCRIMRLARAMIRAKLIFVPPCISHKRRVAETWRNAFKVPPAGSQSAEKHLPCYLCLIDVAILEEHLALTAYRSALDLNVYNGWLHPDGVWRQ